MLEMLLLFLLDRAGTETKIANPLVCCAGMEARELFSKGTSYTYDDVIFHPGYIDFAADQVRAAFLPKLHSSCVKTITLCHTEDAKTA